MKTFGIVLKILAVLAAIAGAIYVIATYGDKIVAWSRTLLGKFRCCCCEAEFVDATTEETPVEEDIIQAEETDFEG